MLNAWVTGANGFIGRHLVQCLVEAGYFVSGIGHGSSSNELDRLGIRGWINGAVSISNLQLLRLDQAEPDVIFHLAGGSSVGVAVANPKEDFERTVASTMELYEWVRLNAPLTRIVLISSAAVYGSGHDSPISEETVLKPYSPYGFHKSMMESLARSYGASYGVRSVIARLFSVYGPGLRKQLLWDLCVKLHGQTSTVIELAGTGQEVRDFIHVRDVVAGLISVSQLACPKCRCFNLGHGQPLTVDRIARTVLSLWGRGGDQLEFNGRSRQGDPFYLVADVSRVASLGLQSTQSFDDGVVEFVQWARSVLITGYSL